ncbi:uncharacterized protein LOC111612624 isoform X1 [Centruroides sculpturatus]|uniref:uncharacterized protein LOC111612624 isoform X1 n=1 Tax=Centruroides sculpturatus TaxID=218467 RepID=UPI000C6D4FD9|nr:uncharacterized protein LOC111612624 isoform X1 [Centruroides sculpturatus]
MLYNELDLKDLCSRLHIVLLDSVFLFFFGHYAHISLHTDVGCGGSGSFLNTSRIFICRFSLSLSVRKEPTFSSSDFSSSHFKNNLSHFMIVRIYSITAIRIIPLGNAKKKKQDYLQANMSQTIETKAALKALVMTVISNSDILLKRILYKEHNKSLNTKLPKSLNYKQFKMKGDLIEHYFGKLMPDLNNTNLKPNIQIQCITKFVHINNPWCVVTNLSQ